MVPGRGLPVKTDTPRVRRRAATSVGEHGIEDHERSCAGRYGPRRPRQVKPAGHRGIPQLS
jgi:hypothetical protein